MTAYIRRNYDDMKSQAESIAEILRDKVRADIRVVETEDATGGGSCPEIKLYGWGVAVKHETYGAGYIQKLLRGLDVPILCGARENEIVVHVRTLQDSDIDTISDGLAGVLNA